MKTIWKGAISFGLVTIPVKVYTATEEKTLKFNQLHAPDGGRIRYKRVCSIDGEEVSYGEIVKGYEYEKDHYVTLTDEELDALPVKTARAIEIERFVDSEQIDPIYFQRSYYLVPDGTGVKAYHLLREAMSDDGRVALAQPAFSDKEHLATVRLRENVLVLETMFWLDEIRAARFDELDEEVELRPQEIKMARSLIDSLSDDFEPKDFQDEYRSALEDLISKKVQGEEVTYAEPAEPSKVVDLMDALRASVEAAQASKPPGALRIERPAFRTFRGVASLASVGIAVVEIAAAGIVPVARTPVAVGRTAGGRLSVVSVVGADAVADRPLSGRLGLLERLFRQLAELLAAALPDAELGPQRQVGQPADRDRQPEVQDPVGDHPEQGDVPGRPEADQRRGQHELDDAQARRRDRQHRQHVGEPVGDQQVVQPDPVPERADEHPQRGGVEQPVGGGPARRAADQGAVGDQGAQAVGEPPDDGDHPVRVEQRQPRGGGAEDLDRSLLATHQQHDHGREGGDEQGAEHPSGAVQRVVAVQRDRRHQGDPEQHVEHHRRADALGGQRERGVGARQPRRGEQPVPQCAARGRAARHHVAHGQGRELRAQQHVEPWLGLAAGQHRPGQQCVGDDRERLQRHCQQQPAQVHLAEAVERPVDAGDLRDQEVDHHEGAGQ